MASSPVVRSGSKPVSAELLRNTLSPSFHIERQHPNEISHPSYSSESHHECDYIISMRNISQGDDNHFYDVFRAAQEAIRSGVLPELIPQGSSGSYFVKDFNGVNIAVFKPKDEEPFAELNPKWPKFFQRVLCFCCFGRACLIPNSGYLSETGASIVDNMLHLQIVPKTRVVKLASPSFFYARCCGRNQVKPKVGSMQIFVHGYESAQTVFGRWDYDKTLLSADEDQRFTFLFQKMCALDYIIRNTDRHMDNLLIRHIPGQILEIAAIDNGLAFPVRHPETASRFRKFPFRWAEMRWAQRPWDEKLREHLTKMITPRFVHGLCRELKNLFNHSTPNSRVLTYKQLQVVRGQIWNLRTALIQNVTPSAMSKQEPIMLCRRYRRNIPVTDDWNDWFRFKKADYNNMDCC